MEDPLYVEINVQAENKHKNGEVLQVNFPLEKHSIILKQGEDNPNFIVHTWGIITWNLSYEKGKWN